MASKSPTGSDVARIPLTRDEPRLRRWFAYAASGHAGFLVLLWITSLISGWWNHLRPPFDPQEVVQVSMVVLPRSADPLPDRTQRTASRKSNPQPQPQPKKPPPEPVRTSDLEVVAPKPQPQPRPSTQERNRKETDSRKKDERDRLLEELRNAPTGAVDRDQTDPNSEFDFALRALGAGAASDPEFARYKARVQQIFMRHFAPLPALVAANPDLRCTVEIRVEGDSGRVRKRTIAQKSGVPAFDAAAIRAAEQVPVIPLPPEKYLPLVESGYHITLTAQ